MPISLLNLKLALNFGMLLCPGSPCRGSVQQQGSLAATIQSHCGNQGGRDVNLRILGLPAITFNTVH